MNCFLNQCYRRRQALRLLAAGVLPKVERTETEGHLVDCADCRNYYGQLKLITASLVDYRDSVASIEPTPAVRHHWSRAIRSERVKSAKPSLAVWCHELFWPGRHVWAGIAALWFVMWAVNWGQPSTRSLSASSTITQTFEEEQRLLAELIPSADREPAEAPRRLPLPHSEWRGPWAIG